MRNYAPATALVFVILLALPSASLPKSDEPVDEISLCDFRVPEGVAHANATFSVVYQIDVGKDGRPQGVTKLKNDFLQHEAFATCLKEWILPVRSEQLVVIFNWEHGKGWTQITIQGPGLSRRIKIQQGWCACSARLTAR